MRNVVFAAVADNGNLISVALSEFAVERSAKRQNGHVEILTVDTQAGPPTPHDWHRKPSGHGDGPCIVCGLPRRNGGVHRATHDDENLDAIWLIRDPKAHRCSRFVGVGSRAADRRRNVTPEMCLPERGA